MEANWSKKFLVECDIPEEDIIIENQSRNTWENALFTSNIIINEEKFKNPKLLLITSAYHMKRAKYCFSKNSLQVDEFSTDNTIGSYTFNMNYLLLPAASSFEKWEILIKEWVGYLAYKINY